jgi:uncharacterized protein YjbI with pentapeptide repeats
MIWPFSKKLKIKVLSKGTADLSRLNLFSVENTTIKNADYSGSSFDSFTAVNVKFINCNFTSVDFKNVCFGAGLKNSFYENCVFDHASINAIAPGRASFINCSFQNIFIKQIFAFNIEMVNCVVSGVIKKGFFNGEIDKSDYKSLNRKFNRFEGNDFSNAKLGDFDFRTNICLEKQKLPEGWRNGT